MQQCLYAIVSLVLSIVFSSCTLPTLTLKQAADEVPASMPQSGVTTTTTAAVTAAGDAQHPMETPVVVIGSSGVNPAPCSENNGNCAPIAQCTSPNGLVVCTCPEGYEGNGWGESGCTPTRSCMNDNGGCDTSPIATCSEAADNNVSCTCPPGYSGSGFGADGCTDIDECTTSNGGCDTSPMATCFNTVGSRTCTCPSGYLGTGVGDFGCSDTDECASNNGGCDTSPVATCSNTTGGRTCSCPSGYTGSGIGDYGCTDINECATNNGGCDTTPMATCTNTTGGRTCSCPSGYTGSGIGDYGCTDINECITNNGGCSTSPMATCTNTLGGRTCECPPGTGTKYQDGSITSRPGEVECLRYWRSSDGVWDYQNHVTWQDETPITYDGCKSTYHDRTNGTVGEACTWIEAALYCISYSSDNDWRLPTRAELSSIVVKGTAPTILTGTFPGTLKTHYWTGTSYDSNDSWEVCFCDGAENWEADTNANDVRCVRDWN